MLMACQWQTKPQPQPLQIPANLKQECPELRKLESGTRAEVLRVMVDDRRKYAECSQGKKALIDAVEKPSS